MPCVEAKVLANPQGGIVQHVNSLYEVTTYHVEVTGRCLMRVECQNLRTVPSLIYPLLAISAVIWADSACMRLTKLYYSLIVRRGQSQQVQPVPMDPACRNWLVVWVDIVYYGIIPATCRKVGRDKIDNSFQCVTQLW